MEKTKKYTLLIRKVNTMEKTVRMILSGKERSLLNACRGCQLEKLCYQSIGINRSAFGNIGLIFNSKSIELSNRLTVADLDGKEDYARLSVTPMSGGALAASLEDGEYVEEFINDIVTDIQIITDTIAWNGENGVRFQLIMDAGVVFTLKDSTLVLQKDVWFSEEISIRSAPSYTQHLLPVNQGWDFEPEANAAFQREIQKI